MIKYGCGQSDMKPLSVLAFFDGRPGHEKQTQGILDALAGMTPVEIDSVKVSLNPAAYLKNLAGYFLPFMQGIFHKGKFLLLERCGWKYASENRRRWSSLQPSGAFR